MSTIFDVAKYILEQKGPMLTEFSRRKPAIFRGGLGEHEEPLM